MRAITFYGSGSTAKSATDSQETVVLSIPTRRNPRKVAHKSPPCDGFPGKQRKMSEISPLNDGFPGKQRIRHISATQSPESSARGAARRAYETEPVWHTLLPALGGNGEPPAGNHQHNNLYRYKPIQPDIPGVLGEIWHIALESSHDKRVAGGRGHRHSPCGHR